MRYSLRLASLTILYALPPASKVCMVMLAGWVSSSTCIHPQRSRSHARYDTGVYPISPYSPPSIRSYQSMFWLHVSAAVVILFEGYMSGSPMA